MARHENIVRYETHFEDKEYIFLVTELAEESKLQFPLTFSMFCVFVGKLSNFFQDHLYSRLKKNGLFHESEGSKYMFDIFKAVNYLHQLKPPVIHRDIKPENILFKDGKLKLADFGWSNFKNSNRRTFCGTRDYLAPEMILKTGHDEKLDVWTLGILTFEVLTGKAPFSPSLKDKTVGQIKREMEFNILNKNPKYPPYMSEKAVDLIKKLLTKDSNLRISCEEALQHEWFRSNGLEFNPNLEKVMNDINTKDESILEQNRKRVTLRRNSLPSIIIQEQDSKNGSKKSAENRLKKSIKAKRNKSIEKFRNCSIVQDQGFQENAEKGDRGENKEKKKKKKKGLWSKLFSKKSTSESSKSSKSKKSTKKYQSNTIKTTQPTDKLSDDGDEPFAPKKTQFFKADGEEKSLEELTISEYGKLNPQMALAEQRLRYQRTKKEAKELRAACRLKNMTIELLQKKIEELNSLRPKKTYRYPGTDQSTYSSYFTTTDASKSKLTSKLSGENGQGNQTSIPPEKMSVLVLPQGDDTIQTGNTINDSIGMALAPQKNDSKKSSAFQSIYYTQQEIDDLEHVSYQYQSLLEENFTLKEQIKVSQAEIQSMQIKILSNFESTDTISDLQKKIKALKDELVKVQFLHEQELISKQKEITEAENKYFEFESRLFQGVGHGLRVKDAEKKKKRLQEWKQKVDFALDRRILDMNAKLKEILKGLIDSKMLGEGKGGQADTKTLPSLILCDECKKNRALGQTGESIDGSGVEEDFSNPFSSNFQDGDCKKCAHLRKKSSCCTRGYCQVNGTVFDIEQKKSLENQNHQLVETLDAIEHTNALKIKSKFETILQEEKLDYLHQIELLREKNLHLNKQLLQHEIKGDKSLIMESRISDYERTIQLKNDTIETLKKQVEAKENEMKVMMKMLQQTNELLDNNQTKEIQKIGKQQAFAINIDDQLGGFRLDAGGEGNGPLV